MHHATRRTLILGSLVFALAAERVAVGAMEMQRTRARRRRRRPPPRPTTSPASSSSRFRAPRAPWRWLVMPCGSSSSRATACFDSIRVGRGRRRARPGRERADERRRERRGRLGDEPVRQHGLRIDAGAARAKPARTGERPLAVAAGEGSIWALNSGDLTVTQIDPETRKVRSTSPPILTRASGRSTTRTGRRRRHRLGHRRGGRARGPDRRPDEQALRHADRGRPGPTGVAVGDGWPGHKPRRRNDLKDRFPHRGQ